MYEYGILRIQHLNGNNTYWLTYEELKNKYPNIRINFLNYGSLINAIPAEYKKGHRSNGTKGDLLQEIRKIEKVPKIIYDKGIDKLAKFPEKAFNRHKNEIGSLDEITYKDAFTILYRCTKSSKLRDFQYRFLHMRLVTNKERKLYGQINSDLCTFCKAHQEDIYHLMIHCPISKNIWRELQSFLYMKTSVFIVFEARDIILGNEFFPFYELYNHLIILTKQYLYACKCLAILPEGNNLLRKIKQEYHTEEIKGTLENKVEKIEKKWHPIM